jgi:hypothetical protein
MKGGHGDNEDDVDIDSETGDDSQAGEVTCKQAHVEIEFKMVTSLECLFSIRRNHIEIDSR